MLNVDAEVLSGTVLGPWVAGLPFEFGAVEWEPRESRLTILEGPAMETGNDGDWESAVRSAEDVTRQLLEAAEASAPGQTAAVVEADSIEMALKELRGGRHLREMSWAKAAERIERRDPEVTAVILVVKRSGLGWPRL